MKKVREFVLLKDLPEKLQNRCVNNAKKDRCLTNYTNNSTLLKDIFKYRRIDDLFDFRSSLEGLYYWKNIEDVFLTYLSLAENEKDI